MREQRVFWIKQRYGGRPSLNDRVVWIDIKKLNNSWRGDFGYYLPPGSPNRTEDWLKRLSFRRVPMPCISLAEDGLVTFTDGRHRFAWMRDEGVSVMPISIGKDQAKEVARRFGAKSRKCILPLKE